MTPIHRWSILSVIVLAGCHHYGLSTEDAAVEGASAETVQTEIFSFEVHGNRLVGLIDTPTHQAPAATIIIVHGYGKTDVVEQSWYSDLRSHFAQMGINVLVWDKPGCGQSEGEFDINQPVESSADEVVAAVHALKVQGIAGSERIGLWGISRAGWIAPLAIKAEPSIDFWISVSGMNEKENARYLLSSNLPIEGRSAEETERLLLAWQRSFDAVWRGGSYEEYLEAASALSKDPFVQLMGWSQPATEEEFRSYQDQYERGELSVDEESGLAVYVPNFDDVLSSIEIPVLALFGDRDTNVDWRKTAELYRETIGNNPEADLSVRVFAGANHNLKQAETGGVREMYGQAWDTPYAEGYFETMADWLIANRFSQPRSRRIFTRDATGIERGAERRKR